MGVSPRFGITAISGAPVGLTRKGVLCHDRQSCRFTATRFISHAAIAYPAATCRHRISYRCRSGGNENLSYPHGPDFSRWRIATGAGITTDGSAPVQFRSGRRICGGLVWPPISSAAIAGRRGNSGTGVVPLEIIDAGTSGCVSRYSSGATLSQRSEAGFAAGLFDLWAGRCVFAMDTRYTLRGFATQCPIHPGAIYQSDGRFRAGHTDSARQSRDWKVAPGGHGGSSRRFGGLARNSVQCNSITIHGEFL